MLKIKWVDKTNYNRDKVLDSIREKNIVFKNLVEIRVQMIRLILTQLDFFSIHV